MATKAELEAELAELRAQIEVQKSDPEPRSETPGPTERDEDMRLPAPIQDLLDEHGIDISNVDATGQQITEELTKLQREYPLAALLGVFVLGYIAGRTFR